MIDSVFFTFKPHSKRLCVASSSCVLANVFIHLRLERAESFVEKREAVINSIFIASSCVLANTCQEKRAEGVGGHL